MSSSPELEHQAAAMVAAMRARGRAAYVRDGRVFVVVKGHLWIVVGGSLESPSLLRAKPSREIGVL